VGHVLIDGGYPRTAPMIMASIAKLVFNIAYYFYSSRMMGWAIVGLAVVLQVGLFIGSLIFLASGQSFEQFRGME